MTEGVTVRAYSLEVSISPGRIVDRAFGPLLDDGTELMVAGVAEEYVLVFSAGLGERASTGDGLEDLRGGETLAVVAELGQEGGRKDLANTGKGREDRRIWMSGKEGLDLPDGSSFVLNSLQGEVRQSDSFGLEGQNGVLGGLRLRLLQAGITGREFAGLGVVVRPGECLELLKSELGSRLGGGKSTDELQTDLQIQGAEHVGRIGIVAPQDVAQAIVGLDDCVGQEEFQAAQSCDLLRQRAVRMPGMQTGPIRAQQVGDQVSIAAIRIGSAGSKTPARVFDHGWWNDIDLGVLARTKKIHEEIVLRLNAHQALLNSHS